MAEHPWVQILDDAFDDMLGKVQVEDVWRLLGMAEGKGREHFHVEHMPDAMKKLGT